ncbi:protein of unknown function (plasmid) [Rhodovastum atsumiense]|nr:protein of unknown function [Rhodovastum atsumiense]
MVKRPQIPTPRPASCRPPSRTTGNPKFYAPHKVPPTLRLRLKRAGRDITAAAARPMKWRLQKTERTVLRRHEPPLTTHSGSCHRVPYRQILTTTKR